MGVSLHLFAPHVMGVSGGVWGTGAHGNGVPTPFAGFA